MSRVPETHRYTVEEVCGLLDDHCLGSGWDPVFVGGIETSPAELRSSEHADKDARTFRLDYYPHEGPRRRHGTLWGMLKDRLGIFR